MSSPGSYRFASRTAGLRSSAIRDLLKVTEMSDMLSLAGGLPTPDSFPLPDLRREADRLLGEYGPKVVQYSATDGVLDLRRWIADAYSVSLGRPIAVEGEILVTHGSQQALELLTRALVDPGELVALADPAYVGALQAFRAAGVELAPIPSDADGLRVDALADRIAQGARPRLVYVVANFDNPSGSTLSAERRIALAQLADRHGFWVVDDDPYGDLRWNGRPPVALRDLTDRAITLGSTSKVLAPGLRIGWAIAPTEVHRSMTILKQSADLHTSALTQQIVHRTLAEPGFLDAHLALLRRTYQHQATHLVDALRT